MLLARILPILSRQSSLSSIAFGRHHMDADEAYREKAWRQLRKNATSYIEKNSGSNIPQNDSCTATYLSSLKPPK